MTISCYMSSFKQNKTTTTTPSRNFSPEKMKIMTRVASGDALLQNLLRTLLDPNVVHSQRNLDFEDMCKFILQERYITTLDDSFILNTSHKYFDFFRSETCSEYNFDLQCMISQNKIATCTKAQLRAVLYKGMHVNVYPKTVFGLILKTNLKRNIDFVYAMRNKCCIHPTIVMEMMTAPIAESPGLCTQHYRSVLYVNRVFKKHNSIPKFSFDDSKISEFLTKKFINQQINHEDWDWMLEISASKRLKLDIAHTRYWRVASLFRHNSLAYTNLLSKIIKSFMQECDVIEPQGVFSFMTGNAFGSVEPCLAEATKLLNNVRLEVLPQINLATNYAMEMLTDKAELLSQFGNVSRIIALGTTLVGLSACIHFTETISQLNVLYNLLPFKLPFMDLIKESCANYESVMSFMTATNDNEAQGLFDAMSLSGSTHTGILTNIAWAVVCAGISGKVASNTGLKGFIGKYGLNNVRGFGFDTLFSYIKNGDSSSRVVEFIEDLLNLCGCNFKTWNTLTTEFESIVVVFDQIKLYLRSEADFKIFAARDDALDKTGEWISGVDNFQIAYASNMKSFIQGRQSQCMTMSTNLISLKKELLTLKAKVIFYKQQNSKIDQAIWIDFVGGSGIGKTYTLKNYIFPVLKEKCNLTDLYTRCDNKHFDGHTDETCFLYDDYNQMDDDKAKEIFKLCSGCPQILSKAGVEEKGVSIIPHLIFTTSNSPKILKTAKVASCEAFERRRTLLIETRINPTTCPIHETMPGFMSCGLVTCGSRATIENLQYRFKPTFSSMWDNANEEWISLAQLIPTLVNLVNERAELNKQELVQDFTETFCNMSEAIKLPTFSKSQNFDSSQILIDVVLPGMNVDGNSVNMSVNVDSIDRKRRNMFSGYPVFSQNLNGFKEARIEVVLDYINGNNFDIICLQEVSELQLKSIKQIPGYRMFTSDIAKSTLVTLISDVWNCKRITPVIASERPVISIDMELFVITNFHFSPNERVHYPVEGFNIFCGDTNGMIPDLYRSDKSGAPTCKGKVYDIISASYDAFISGCVGSEFQSDHNSVEAVISGLRPEGSLTYECSDDEEDLTEFYEPTACEMIVHDSNMFLEQFESFFGKFNFSRLQKLATLCLNYSKQGNSVFSYLWEDFAIAGMGSALEATDIEYLANPAISNCIFATYEFYLYWRRCNRSDIDVTTLQFLYARCQAFLFHATQHGDMLDRIARHSSYNGENWDSKSPLGYVVSLFKYWSSGNFANLTKAVAPVTGWLSELKNYSVIAFTTSTVCFAPVMAEKFLLTRDYCQATLEDMKTWAILNSMTNFRTSFVSHCTIASTVIADLCISLRDFVKSLIQGVYQKVKEHPIMVSGGLACFMAAAYMYYTGKSEKPNVQDARLAGVLSYDDQYNVTFKTKDVVQPSQFNIPSVSSSVPSVTSETEDTDSVQDAFSGESISMENFTSAFDDEEISRIRKSKKDPEGTVDARLSDQVLPALRQNMVTISCNGYKMGAIFIGGTTFVCPKHFLIGSKAKGVETITILSGMEPIDVLVDFNDVNSCIKCVGSDLMAVNLTCARMPAYRNIVSHFLPADILKNVVSEEIILLTRQCLSRKSAFTERLAKATRQLDVNYGLDGVRLICEMGLSYRMNTSPGDCGSAAILTNIRYNSKLYGFHVAGLKGKPLGYSQSISIETVRAVMQHFKDIAKPLNIIANGYIEESDIKSLAHARVVPGNMENHEGNFTYVGTLPPSKIPFRPSKTDLRKTQIFEEVTPSVKGPAVLKPVLRDGVLIHPMKASLDKYAKPLKPFNPHLLKRIENFLVSKYKLLLQGTGTTLSLYSEYENILGRDDGLGKIPHNTSVGYPYTMQGLKKKDLLDYDSGEIINNDFKEDVITTELNMSELRHSGQVWTDCLKDEKRALEKIEEVKTRTFAIPSVTTTYVTRKYFGAAVDFLTNQKITTPYTVGINAEGPEWTQLFQKHNSHSRNIIAGDYSKYDGTSPPEMVAMFANIVNALYDDEHSNIRSQICNELTHTLQLSENLLYFTHQGIPSGSPLTVYVNSAINEMLMMYAYLELGQEHNIALTSWETNVRLSTYGDDNLLSVSDEAALWYHFDNISEVFSRYGLKYTPEDKTSGGFHFKSIYDVSFLKRKFVRDSDFPNRILAPISTESINELFNWYRTGMNEDEILYVNIDDAMRKAHALGRVYYNTLLNKTNKVLLEHELSPVNYSWVEQNCLWHSQFH